MLRNSGAKRTGVAAWHYTNLFSYINECACADLFQALEVIREGLALASLVYKGILNNGNLVDTLRFFVAGAVISRN